MFAVVVYTDLNARLAESDAQRQILASEHVRIRRSFERFLHLFQLERRERHPSTRDTVKKLAHTRLPTVGFRS